MQFLSLLAFVRDLVSVGRDHWTWTTRTGEWFEDVEIKSIQQDEVVIQHKFGVVRLAIDRLSDDSRRLLFRSQAWAGHAATCGRIESFPAQHALAA